MFHGWGDESGSVPSRDPDVFILAAAVAAPEDADELWAVMAALRRTTEKKIHWRGDSADRHRHVIATIAELPLEAVVVVRKGLSGEPPERRRRKCFERFVMELEQLGCSRLTLESRGPRADQRDRTMLDTMRARRWVTGELKLAHRPGPVDPRLWIADAVCGAVVSARTGDDRFLERIRSRVHLIEP